MKKLIVTFSKEKTENFKLERESNNEFLMKIHIATMYGFGLVSLISKLLINELGKVTIF